MGLLDYYKQFEGMTDEEVSAELREVADERRRKALERVEPLDVSSTAWHEFPHPDVVNAVTYAARRGINRYGDVRASELRVALGRRYGIEAERIVVGEGAGQLLTDLARELLEPGDELLTPWPSYPLYPLMATRVRARPVPVPGRDAASIMGGLTGRTRVVVLCNPNDPTGAYTPAAELRELLDQLPESVTLVLDEALIDFVDAETTGASLELLDEYPRLIVVRSFSKAHALGGLRCGYALGGLGSEQLLERLGPPLGVSSLAQAGALEAFERCSQSVVERRAIVVAERRRLRDALTQLPIDAPETQANFVWLSSPKIDGSELAFQLERLGVIVKPGAEFGANDHIRVTLQSPEATDRLLRALELTLAQS